MINSIFYFVFVFTDKPAHTLNYCHVDWVPTKYLLSEFINETIDNEYLSYKENMGFW